MAVELPEDRTPIERVPKSGTALLAGFREI